MPLTDDLRAVAKKLLAHEGDEDEAKRVEVVIGHGRGTLPLRSTPVFARTAGEADGLVFDATCGANLVRYLKDAKGRAAVVVKGCDVRSFVEAVKEKQLDPGKVVAIAVPCEGVIDLDKVLSSLGGPELASAELDGPSVNVTTLDGEKTLALDEVLSARCRSCDVRAPVIPEGGGIEAEVLGGEAAAPSAEGSAAVKAFEEMTREERWAFFAEQASKCILCYACRSACPLCYCAECFVESTQPRWLGREFNLSNAQVFHLMRALHLAGRCVGCGDCMRACPMGVDLGVLGEKLREEVKALYETEPGADPDAPQPLTAYREDDWQEFIM